MNTEYKTSDDDLSHEDARARIDIREGEGGSVIYKDPEGMEHAYYPADHISLVAERIRIVTSIHEYACGIGNPIGRRLEGYARTDYSGISIIGHPVAKNGKLNLYIDAVDFVPHVETPLDLEGLDTRFIGSARLGFSPGINECNIWCQFSAQDIELLLKDLSSGRVAKLKLSAWIKGLYRDSLWDRGNIFVWLGRDAKDKNFLEGRISSITWETQEADLKDRIGKDSRNSFESAVDSSESTQTDRFSSAILKLTASIDFIKRTIAWAAGLIVIALLFIAWK